MSGPRMTLQTQVVLHALLADPDKELYGLEIADRTGLLPGTTYPILVRLEQAGWLKSRWEEIDPHDEQRPRRRYYRLTSDGAAFARQALARHASRAAQTVKHWGLAADGTP